MVSFSDIPKLRLLSQQLLLPQFTLPREVVRWMGAMQAQDYHASIRAICARLQDTVCTDIAGAADFAGSACFAGSADFSNADASIAHTLYDEAEAAFNRGDFVRTHVLRPTWHLVAAEDIRWMLELTAPRIKSLVHARDVALGLSEADFKKSNAVFNEVLRGGRHLLREELAKVLEDAGVDASAYRLAHLLMRAELDAVICSGALRGKKQTYALLSERAPRAKRFDRETSFAMLAERYFTSRGPATLKDFTWWSGLTTGEARRAIAMVAVGIVEAEAVADELAAPDSTDRKAQTYYIHRGLQDAEQPKLPELPPGTVHLLPAFDEYLIAYADRSAVIAAEHISKAITSNGIFRPTILRDGIVTGTWKTTGRGIEESYF